LIGCGAVKARLVAAQLPWCRAPGCPCAPLGGGPALSAMTPRAHCIVYVSGITHRTLPQQSEGRASGQNKKAVGAGTNAVRLAL
jgi:hypothetical protein